MRRTGTIITTSLFLILAMQAQSAETSNPEPLLGRWGITAKDSAVGSPSWLEVAKADGKYKVRFCGPVAGVGDLDKFEIKGDKIEFTTNNYTKWEEKWHWSGQVKDGKLVGTRVDDRKENKVDWSGIQFVPRVDFTGIWTIADSTAGLDGKIELLQQGDIIKGRLVGKETNPISEVKQNGNELSFRVAKGQNDPAAKVFKVQIKGDQMEGTAAAARKQTVEFKATRQRNWGEPIELFNGKDLSGWTPVGEGHNFNWKAEDGVLAQPKGGDNIQTKQKFQDFKLHIEFKVPQGGNSGVYLRGRYEVQVEDSFGAKPESYRCGGLYSRVTPPVNASKKAGEWQSYDVTLIGQYLTLKHNDQLLYDNIEIEGITGGALDSNEAAPGPIYLQGDHGAIWYRNIVLTPAGEPIAPKLD